MFARTSRLTLRPAWPEDASALARAIAHEQVVMKLSRAPWPYGEADAAAFIEARSAAADDFFCLIVAHEGGPPAIVGGIGLHPASGLGADQTAHEIGYWLTPTAWGRGYATEAAQAVIDIARHTLRLKRLSASHFLDNPASGRVMRKLGFHPTGRIVTQRSRSRGEVESAVYELALDEAPAAAPQPLAA